MRHRRRRSRLYHPHRTELSRRRADDASGAAHQDHPAATCQRAPPTGPPRPEPELPPPSRANTTAEPPASSSLVIALRKMFVLFGQPRNAATATDPPGVGERARLLSETAAQLTDPETSQLIVALQAAVDEAAQQANDSP